MIQWSENLFCNDRTSVPSLDMELRSYILGSNYVHKLQSLNLSLSAKREAGLMLQLRSDTAKSK